MAKRNTQNEIKQAACREFLEKGFRTASLRNIVKEAGVTTGAFYGYYRSKEELFEALVLEQYEELLVLFQNAFSEFLQMDYQTEHKEEVFVGEHLKKLIDYIYDNMTAFKLILCCSEGTKYENVIHNMAKFEIDSSGHFSKGIDLKDVNADLEHMLISGMFTAFFEVVVHEYPKEKAVEYSSRLLEFYSAGWQRLKGL